MNKLTATKSSVTLCAQLPHEVDQDWSLENKRHKPLLRGIFMRKIQLHIVMLGLGKALERVGGLVCSIRPTLSSSQHLDWSQRVGLKTLQTEAIMPKYAQEPTKSNTPTLNVRLKSLFTLHDANRNTIASSLTFEQIKPIAEHINGAVIKFDRMGGVA